jgi:chromatin remodeling complex protein RSC6
MLRSVQIEQNMRTRAKKIGHDLPVFVGISCVNMSSTNTSVPSTMNTKNTVDSTPKKVAKKVVASAGGAAPVAAASASAATPVVAAASVATKKVAKKADVADVAGAAVAAVANVAAVSTPVAAETVVEATSSLADELTALQTQLTALRDGASAALLTLKRVAKRASQEVKEAHKNRKRTRAEPAEGEVRKPSNFEIAVPISDELSVFLGGGKSNSMSRAQVTKAINLYVNERNLRVKHDITPDAALRKLLNVDDSVKLTIFNMQTYLGRHYLKPAAKATA